MHSLYLTRDSVFFTQQAWLALLIRSDPILIGFCHPGLQLGKGDRLLVLVLALLVGVRCVTRLVTFEEEYLGDTLIRIDFCRERGGIGNLQGHEPLPFWLEGGHIDDDTAARISAFSDTYCQYAAGDAEIFDSARQGEGIRWDDADFAFKVDHQIADRNFSGRRWPNRR